MTSPLRARQLELGALFAESSQSGPSTLVTLCGDGVTGRGGRFD